MVNSEWMLPFEQEVLADPYTAEKIDNLNAELLQLLSVRTQRYTMGESSSVTVEVANELLKSICFTLELACQAKGLDLYALPENTSLSALFLAGQAEIEKRVLEGKKLLSQALRLLEMVEDPIFHETVLEIKQFFRRYDTAFFAHDIPCGIDYLLDTPVSEHLQGIEYITAYLTQLLEEGETVPRLRRQEELRLEAALKAEEDFQHTDGSTIEDEHLRTVLEEINASQNSLEKAAIIIREVHSLRDMVELLDVCFWGEEAVAVFEQLNTPELALLYRFAQKRIKEKRSPTQWEQALYGYLTEKRMSD